MGTYILKRVLLFIPTLIAITIVTFLISRLAPGDPAELIGGQAGENQVANKEKTLENIKKIRKEWHLDEPYPVQYYLWAKGIFTLDFGKSLKDNQPVIDKIAERIPVTFVIGFFSILLTYAISIPIGIYSAARPGSWLDRFLSTSLFAMYSLPQFWIATLAVIFICSREYVMIFPEAGLHASTITPDTPFFEWLVDSAWHLILPILMFTFPSLAYISRQMRGAMLEVIRQDYIRTARAKGLSEKVVVLRHALRNSLIPIITLISGLFPALVGGSIVVESIFSIPGTGLLAFNALNERDYTIIMGELTMSAVLTMFGVLFSDIMYSVVDPRIAFERKNS
ncbi:MAG TPA: ABC transporter permease [Candidatus Kapabacteria bacterium]|nr:ABC transporter permease [Candidatus Kapabacteria bacterium]